MDRETANADAGTPTMAALENYIARYRHKADVLRRIHSNKAESARKRDIQHTLAVVFLGAIITFLGFMGPERILASLRPAPASTRVLATQTAPPAAVASSADSADIQNRSHLLVDLAFNSAVLALFLVSLLNLIYRWKEKQAEHFAGVVKLTGFINWLDETALLHASSMDLECIKQIRSRYQHVVDGLPPNDEKDYEQVKAGMSNKRRLRGDAESAQLHSRRKSNSSDEADMEFVCSLVKSSPLMMHVLEQLQETDEALWLSGGAVRNHVWSCLTGRMVPVDDFDVAYFDAMSATADRDHSFEAKLSQKLPSWLRLSVKNQARMHLITGEPRRDSLAEAIGNYPETASCLAVRLIGASHLELLAPMGLGDLLDMVVRPTPFHAVNRDSYERRKATKNWKAQWPEIRYAEDSVAASESDHAETGR